MKNKIEFKDIEIITCNMTTAAIKKDWVMFGKLIYRLEQVFFDLISESKRNKITLN